MSDLTFADNLDKSQFLTRRIHIPEFEGLRGLLAAWVVLGHILLISGFQYADGWFGIIFSPILGVYVFMILSGFVIAASLDQRPSSWVEFIKRRFWRLFPIYAICMAIAIALFDVSIAVSNSKVMQQFGPENLSRLSDVKENFSLYLFADASLLQCLLPQGSYPYGTESFLPPTWSLTIEWLFYLQSPLFFWLLRKRKATAFTSLILYLAVICLFREKFTNWNPSFRVGIALYFLTGIGTYFAWKIFPDCRKSYAIKFGFWIVAASLFCIACFPYKVWLTLVVLLLYSKINHKKIALLELLRSALLSKSAQFLGRTSYATYLLHWLVIEITLFWIAQIYPNASGKGLVATVCVVVVFPITYLISDILNRCVEVPVVRWHKQSYTTKPGNHSVTCG